MARKERQPKRFLAARIQVPHDTQLNGQVPVASATVPAAPALAGKKIPHSLDEILTLEECAAWLLLKPRDLLAKVRAGRIPAIRLNQRVLRFHPRTVLLRLGVPSEAVGVVKPQTHYLESVKAR